MELAYPLRTQPNGELELVTDDLVPLQSVRQILDVRLLEVPWELEYGSELGLFEAGTYNQTPIKTAINQWLETEYFAVVGTSFTEQMLRQDDIELADSAELFVGRLGQ